ncbi:uncharacterized protein LOC133832454 [Humulus lupulus]|uniref:uncharacterized protein LOC133832454 n=1 Tax=Humulus lupulus TaxID=3486 RepID=UPI002B40AD93|nr:uncharacterized protein LOC133832454 [Humulus lupulus]
MVVVLRYVDKYGRVIERFVGIEHVANTTAMSLKGAIDKLFSSYGLSISKLRGQGYDGASNMQGEFSCLKTLILNENPSAFYVHCFAHQLQLALVAVAKKHIVVAYLFSVVTMVINVVGCSSKRCDILREKQDVIISEALKCGEISSGRGLNQETNLKRLGDIRWGSHYATLSTFNESIVVSTFCAKYNVDVPDMDDTFVAQELNERFNEVNTELLLRLAYLCPGDSFVSFDKKKLVRFAEYYPKDFSTFQLMILNDQLETYIIDVCSTEKFLGLKSIGDLSQKMVETKKNIVYPLVYRLITLALILPIVTATVERVFSAMNILKNRFRNRMGD